LWLLNGRCLIAMTETSAMIECSGGARQTYHRTPEATGQVLAWALKG
jgi:hypothetical protein